MGVPSVNWIKPKMELLVPCLIPISMQRIAQDWIKSRLIDFLLSLNLRVGNKILYSSYVSLSSWSDWIILWPIKCINKSMVSLLQFSPLFDNNDTAIILSLSSFRYPETICSRCHPNHSQITIDVREQQRWISWGVGEQRGSSAQRG